MKKTHVILLSVLTIIMIGATVLYVHAENMQQNLPTQEPGETGIQSAINISDTGFSQTQPANQAPSQTFQTATDELNQISSPAPVMMTTQTKPTTSPTVVLQQATQVTSTSQVTSRSQNTQMVSPTAQVSVVTTQPITTLTRTPTPQTGWAGEWTVWYGAPSETHTKGSMIVSVTGTSLSAVAAFNGLEITLEGNLNPDKQSLSGQYASPMGDGWFLWQHITSTQFGGTLDNQQVFCAARPGAPKPEPCGIFSTL